MKPIDLLKRLNKEQVYYTPFEPLDEVVEDFYRHALHREGRLPKRMSQRFYMMPAPGFDAVRPVNVEKEQDPYTRYDFPVRLMILKPRRRRFLPANCIEVEAVVRVYEYAEWTIAALCYDFSPALVERCMFN